MSTIVFRRPPRQKAPELPSGELSLQEPPVLPEAPTGNLGATGVFVRSGAMEGRLSVIPAAGTTQVLLAEIPPGWGVGPEDGGGRLARMAPEPDLVAHVLNSPGQPPTVDWLSCHRALATLFEPGVEPVWRAA